MTGSELIEGILTVLAEIRAVPIDDLRGEVQEAGMEGITVTSLEVVAILVSLEPMTSLDASDPEVLQGCNVQTLQQLTEFMTAESGQ